MKTKKLISLSLAIMLLAGVTFPASSLAKGCSEGNLCSVENNYQANKILPEKYKSHLYEKITVSDVKKAILEMGECGLSKEQVEKYYNQIKETMSKEELKEILTQADKETVTIYKEIILDKYGFLIKCTACLPLGKDVIDEYYSYIELSKHYDSLLKIDKDLVKKEMEATFLIFDKLNLGDQRDNFKKRLEDIYKNNHTFDAKNKLREEAREYSRNHTTSWINNGNGWWYQESDGTYPANTWKNINETWYHFDASGYMQTGWLNLDGTWYYLNDDGSMAKDTWIDGTYYVDASGAWVVEGWQQNSYGWWYQRANGTYPASEWETINGTWYYFDANGYMLADKATPDGYYVDANGAWIN